MCLKVKGSSKVSSLERMMVNVRETGYRKKLIREKNIFFSLWPNDCYRISNYRCFTAVRRIDLKHMKGHSGL